MNRLAGSNRVAWVALLSSLVAACASEAAPPQLESVRMTYLEVRYALDRPVYVNNRVPITFGLTGVAGDPTISQDVAVTFSFVEASPADPAAPIECASNALIVGVAGDGEEHRFDGFIWPTTLCASLVGREVALRVEFDGGEDAETGIDYPPVVFSAAEQGAEINQLCRSGDEPGAARGCAYTFDLQPTPSDASGTLVDVRYAGLAPRSSVAVVPQPAEGTEASAAMLVIESTLVVNGRDPYIAATSPELVPADLEALEPGITDDLRFGLEPGEVGRLTVLPGRATLRFEVAPAGSESGWLPLTIGEVTDDEGALPDARVPEVVIERLLPGTANVLTHELFVEGETLAALSEGGAWSTIGELDVRACFEAEFAQAGNDGEGDLSDCRTVTVMLVRDAPLASAATERTFDAELSRQVGSPGRIALGAELTTRNRLDASGVSSRVEGVVNIEGRLGRSFEITVARAMARATLGVDPADTGYEVTVDVFGQRVLSRLLTEASITNEDDFTVARSFSFPGLGFGFGPVRVGFRFGLGGEVGLATNDALSATTDAATCADLLGTADAMSVCGSMTRSVAPHFAFTASVEGGISLRIVRASVVANLRLVNTDFPLDASLAWGVRDDGRVLVRGDARWGMGLRLIEGNVAIVGRVGVRRFSRTLRVNLFSFSSPRFTRTLLDRSLAVEVLD